MFVIVPLGYPVASDATEVSVPIETLDVQVDSATEYDVEVEDI